MMRVFARIVAAVDLSDGSPAVVDIAADLARQHAAVLDLVHTSPPTTATDGHLSAHDEARLIAEAQRLDALRARALERGALHVEAHRLEGPAAHEIVEFARRTGSDLIVTGQVDASVIVGIAPCAVLTMGAAA
jgi:nucleotide-binding universal stress UspA family protein